MPILNPYAELVIVCLMLAIFKIVGIKMTRLEDMLLENNKTKFLLWQTFLLLPLLAVVFLFVFFDDVSSLGLNMDFSWNRFFIALGVGFPLSFVVIAIRKKIPKKDEDEQLKRKRKALLEFFAPRTALELAFQIIYVAIFLAGIGEEIVFRGFLQNRLETVVGNLFVAVAIQAVVFGIAHLRQGLKGIVMGILEGLVFSFVYVFSGTLVAAIVLHASFDSIGFIFFYTARKRGQLDKMADDFF